MRNFLSAGKRLLFALSILWALGTAADARAEDWPQWLGVGRDGVWREDGVLEKFPEGGPKVRWRTKIGAGYSGPAVAGGKVYITDRVLEAGAQNPANPFDTKSRVAGLERVLCLDEKTGEVLWQHEYKCPYRLSYGSGPRTTPAVDGDRVYTLGAMGDLYCLSTRDGSVVWHKNLPQAYNTDVPKWGFAGHPLVDGDRLICLVGGEGSVAVAFDKMTGKEVWKNLTADEPGYAPPMIYEIGGTRQLIMWHPRGVHSLDPKTGKVHWFQPFPLRGGELKAGMSIPTPRLYEDQIYVTCFYNGSLLFGLGKDGLTPDVKWAIVGRSEEPQDTKALQSVMVTPFLFGGHIYGVGSYGELRCLDAKTGERVWSNLEPVGGEPIRWGTAFLTKNGDRFFLFNEHGDLIIAHLSPKGYQEIDRAKILPPTNTMAGPRGRRVIWSHPAYANRACFARNDNEIICVELGAEK